MIRGFFLVVLSAFVATPALAQRLEARVGSASFADGRLADILKATQCQDFTDQFHKKYLATGNSGGAGLGDSYKVRAGTSKRISRADFRMPADPNWDRRALSAKNNGGYRVQVWNADDVLGRPNGFRGEMYRRYATPRGAPAGTYNLTFVVVSDNDEIFLCIQGTEPEIFPTGIPRGNTLNNLAASPIRNPLFDPVALVHSGWSTVAAYYHRTILRPILARHGMRNKKVTIVGHSQGAVLAGYIGFLFVKNHDLPRNKPHRLVTLAAPRYGTPTMLSRFRQVLRQNNPRMTVDALETHGDAVPFSWPMGTVPVGFLWRNEPTRVGYTWSSSIGSKHFQGISSFHALQILRSGGRYKGPKGPLNQAALAPKKLGKAIARSIPSTCPSGFSRSGLACVGTNCPTGSVRRGNACVSACPRNSKHSATGNHCMTRNTKVRESTRKVWVGNLKPKRAYVKACPTGTKYSHDLAGYSYCKSGGCPAGYPTRRGGNCHASCGSLRTDPFGNCIVKSRPLPQRPLGCPAGYRLKGPVCVK